MVRGGQAGQIPTFQVLCSGTLRFTSREIVINFDLQVHSL